MSVDDSPYIRNYTKVRRVVTDHPRHGNAGVVMFSFQVRDSYLRECGYAPEKDQKWHDVEYKCYQDPAEYFCEDCSVEMHLDPLGVREDRCDEHAIDAIRYVDEDGEVLGEFDV